MKEDPDKVPRESGGSEGEVVRESAPPGEEPWLGGTLTPVALTAVAWTMVASRLPDETAIALAWLAILGATAGFGWHQGRAAGDVGGYGDLWWEGSIRRRIALAVLIVVAVVVVVPVQVVAGTGVFVATGVSAMSAVVMLAFMWAPDLPDDYHRAIRTRAVRLRRGMAIRLGVTASITWWLLPAPDPFGHGFAASFALLSLFAGAAAGWIWSRTHAWRLDLRVGS